jgi:hypothetical protein
MHAANIVGDKIDVMKFELHAISVSRLLDNWIVSAVTQLD